jgi:hypothetical protein
MAQMHQFAARSVEASQLRRRKYELVRRFGLPENLVGGSLSQTHRRCGRPNCHCADGPGHSQWSITFCRGGNRRVERVPREWVEELERAVVETQVYVDAVREVMAINVELLAETRRQEQEKKVRARAKNVPARVTNDQLSPAAIDPLTM